MAQARFNKSYNSFSGVDMIVTFGGRWIGELQGVSYSVTREKVPTYTMGDANPRAFSRGKRGIAGALVFALFDRSALLEEMNKVVTVDPSVGRASGFGATSAGVQFPEGYRHYGKDALETNEGQINEISLTQRDNIYYDEILPFNIVVSGANEYGVTTSMEIVGIELLNSGAGMSIDDIQTNETCSFLARDIRHWQVQSSAGGVGKSIATASTI